MEKHYVHLLYQTLTLVFIKKLGAELFVWSGLKWRKFLFHIMYRYNKKWSTQVLTTSSKTSSLDVVTKRENTEYRVQSNFFKLFLLESALNSVLELLLTYKTCDWLFSGDNILNNIFFTTVYFSLCCISARYQGFHSELE